MKKMLIILLLAIHRQPRNRSEKRYRHIPPCFPTTEKGKR